MDNDDQIDEAGEKALRRGLRTDPLSAEAMQRIRAAAFGEWKSTVAATSRRRSWVLPASLAAGIVLTVLGSLCWFALRSPDRSTEILAKLERAEYPGALELRRWAKDRVLESGESLHGGQRVQLRGGARLELPAGASLRLAAGSTFEVLSANRIRLTDGSLYLDVPPANSAQMNLTVETAAGAFAHVGTQFQVAVQDGQTVLMVREGQVRWLSGSGEVLADAGTLLRIDRQGKATREQVAASGPTWSWAESLAASFDIENQPLTSFLRHVARETGRTLVYAGNGIEQRADATVLHGSMRDLDALEALSAVMATTNLRYTLDGGSIHIESGGDTESGK